MTTIDLGRAGSYRPPAVPPYRPVAPMRKATAASMRKLADDIKTRHPDMGAHLHVQDAARALDRNQPEAANRHLTAAIGNMTPQSLRRHGLLTDEHHDAAKRSMDAVHRHMLLVKDIIDTQAHNNSLPRNDQDEPQAPKLPVDDNLDEKPTARDSGEKAMNAPARENIGRIDINVSKPQQSTGTATKQVAASYENGDLTTAIELVGPKGYVHGWKYVGGAGLPAPKPKALRAPGREDPRSVIAVGGGRKNWENEASQMPDRGVRHDFPAVAERMRQVTPERLQQARDDDTRIGNGLAPLHPELAQIWPDVYGKHPGTGKLATPKAPRNKPDPYSVTGLDSPSVSYLKAAIHQQMRGSGISASNGDLTTAIDLSAQTGALATVPHPFGKPGGPGLWGVKGMELPPYVQNIAHALLRTGRAKDEGEAIAMARAATQRWKTGKNTSPEVRAASAASDADWRAKQARAHAHANDSAGAIEMGIAAWVNESRASGGQWIAPPSKLDVAESLASRALHVATPSQRFFRKSLAAKSKNNPKRVARAIRRQQFIHRITGGPREVGGLGPMQMEAANRGPALEFVGPKGYIHGYIYVGGSGLPKPTDKLSGKSLAKAGANHALMTRPPQVGDDMPSKGFSSPGGLKASKVTAGDKVMGSFSGGPAGLKMHSVLGAKHQTTITVRNTRTGKVHTQKINSATKRDDGKAFGQTKAGDTLQGHYRGDPLGKTDAYQVVKAKHETTLHTMDPDTGEEHTQTVASGSNVKMSRSISRINAASKRKSSAHANDGTGALEFARSRGFTAAQTRLYIELVGTAAGAAQDSRTPLGTFGAGGSTSKNTSSSSGARTTQNSQSKSKASATASKNAQAKAKSNASKKAGLLKQAAGYRAQADALIKQRDAMRAALASASGKTSSGQSGSTTSAGASTTASSASTTPSSASTTSSSSTTPSSSSTSSASSSPAASTAAIATLNTQITQLQGQYRQAMAQASKL